MVDFYIGVIKRYRKELLKLSTLIVADAYFSTQGVAATDAKPRDTTRRRHGRNKAQLWPHLWVCYLTRGGPWASVGTSRLGYPLLMGQDGTPRAILSHRVAGGLSWPIG